MLGAALGHSRERSPEWDFYGAKQNSGQGENQYLTPSMWAGRWGEREKELIKKEEPSKNKHGNYLTWDLKSENYSGKVGEDFLN